MTEAQIDNIVNLALEVRLAHEQHLAFLEANKEALAGSRNLKYRELANTRDSLKAKVKRAEFILCDAARILGNK